MRAVLPENQEVHLNARMDASLPGNVRPVLMDEIYHPGMSADIDALQTHWAQILEGGIRNLRDATLFDILLCTREAVLNGLIHGCKETDDTRLLIELAEAGSAVVVTVSDPGPGHSFDAHIHDKYDLLDLHRGLYLIWQFAGKVESLRNGATLVMTFNVVQAPVVYGEC